MWREPGRGRRVFAGKVYPAQNLEVVELLELLPFTLMGKANEAGNVRPDGLECIEVHGVFSVSVLL